MPRLTAGFLLALALVLSGCTSGPPTESAPPAQEELAAMAQDAREKVVDCLQQRGWDVVLEPDGWRSGDLGGGVELPAGGLPPVRRLTARMLSVIIAVAAFGVAAAPP